MGSDQLFRNTMHTLVSLKAEDLWHGCQLVTNTLKHTCLLHVRINLSPFFLTVLVPMPLCLMYVRVCTCECVCVLPHPGGLASILHRRCSSLPQSHLAPLPQRPPPLQACIPTTTSTSTTITAPTSLQQPTNHNASTLLKKLISFFFFPPSTLFLPYFLHIVIPLLSFFPSLFALLISLFYLSCQLCT